MSTLEERINLKNMGESTLYKYHERTVNPETKPVPASLPEVVRGSSDKYTKDSGARLRNKVEVVATFGPETTPEPTSEQMERAQELQKKVVDLCQHYGVSLRQGSGATLDQMLLCLDPGTQEYAQAHLSVLDGLVWGAEYFPEDLSKADQAVKIWEDLAASGSRPIDFVNDGLEVDADNMIVLREFLENAKSDVYGDRYQKIIEYFEQTHPKLANLLETEGPLQEATK